MQKRKIKKTDTKKDDKEEKERENDDSEINKFENEKTKKDNKLMELYCHIIKSEEIIECQSLFNNDKLIRNNLNFFFDITCNLICEFPFADYIHQLFEKRKPYFFHRLPKLVNNDSNNDNSNNNNEIINFEELEKECVKQNLLKSNMVNLGNAMFQWVNDNKHSVFAQPFSLDQVSLLCWFFFVFCFCVMCCVCVCMSMCEKQ